MMSQIRSSYGRHSIEFLGQFQGFTYLGVLIVLAILGVISAATLQAGSLFQRRAAEDELLSIGAEFRDALVSYANATPAGKPRSPQSLQELIKDPRYASPRRHLRKLYVDPITGQQEWGIVPSPDGYGIIGVYSLSEARPIKVGNFSTNFDDFSGKKSYQDWKFVIPAQLILTNN